VQEMTWRDHKRPEVTRKLCQLAVIHRKVAVEGRKLAYSLDFTSYKAVARSRKQSRDRK